MLWLRIKIFSIIQKIWFFFFLLLIPVGSLVISLNYFLQIKITNMIAIGGSLLILGVIGFLFILNVIGKKKLNAYISDGEKKRNHKIYFLNIHYNIEEFTKEEFREYKKRYFNFYKTIAYKNNKRFIS